MKEATFITFDGTTKVCSIPDDITLDYKCLITTIRKELSVQDDYRIKVFREGCEDALNPSSDFQSGDKYFVLYEQLSHEKTEELIYFITSRYELVREIPFTHKMTTDIFRTTIYNRIEKLINEGAHIEGLYTINDDINDNIQWLMSYIIRFEDIELLKLLFNNGLDINSPLMIESFTNDRIFSCDLFADLFILYKIDLSCHYDIKSKNSMTNLGKNHRLIALGISKNMFTLNTLIPPNNTAFFYCITNLDKFLDKYKYPIDYNLPSFDGGSFISGGALYSDSKYFEHILNKYSQIDINLQYNFSKKHKHTKPGDTLLHMLCRQEKLDIVKIQLLLDRDVELIKNDEGETQIDVLHNRNDTQLQQEILQILEKYFDTPSEIK